MNEKTTNLQKNQLYFWKFLRLLRKILVSHLQIFYCIVLTVIRSRYFCLHLFKRKRKKKHLVYWYRLDLSDIGFSCRKKTVLLKSVMKSLGKELTSFQPQRHIAQNEYHINYYDSCSLSFYQQYQQLNLGAHMC